MKKAIPYIIIAALLFLLFLKSCGNEKTEPQIIEVEVPAQSGEFEPQTPKHTPIVHNPVKDIDSVETKWKTTQNPINKKLLLENKELLAKYETAKDSLERYKLYVDAIQIRDFESHFEDEFLDLTISGKVQGEVKSIFPEYTIKPRTTTATITPKRTVFRLLGGLEVGNNTSFNDFRYKVNLGLQNAKGNIFGAAYEKWNGQDYIWARYEFSIFQIRR